MEIYKKNNRLGSYLVLLISLIAIGIIQPVYALENPEYVKMKDWKMEKFGAGKMVLSCKAVFYNPNKAKAKLKAINLGISIGDTNAGKVTQVSKRVKIKKKSAFEIPLRIEINPETNAWGYLSGILSALTLQDFVVNVKGYIKASAMGVTLKIPVSESEQLNLKEILISGN